MDATLTATSAAACLASPLTPPTTGAQGTTVSGMRFGAVAAAGAGLVVGSATGPAYPPAFRLLSDSHTDATQVPPRGRPV